MSDLISRQDALKPFCVAPDGTRIPEVDCDNFPVEFSVKCIKKHLLSLPSADRPTGEWIAYKGMQPTEFHGKHYCSNCYHAIHLASNGNVYNYCPKCGARMKGADDETY